MNVTLKEIARKAGVSISTVSRIINNDQNKPASKDTTEKVWSIVRELGYVPNFDARNLVKKRRNTPHLNKTIGCILTSESDNYKDPFFSQLMMGLQSEAALNGFVLGYTFSYLGDKSVFFQQISSNKVDGAVVLGRMNEDVYNFLRGSIRNLVYAGLNKIGRNLDEVICDAYEATCCAIEYLISLKHKKIGYIGVIPSKDKNSVINEHRFTAYKDTLTKYNTPLNYNQIKNANLFSKDGFDAMNEIIKSCDLPTAVFCGNDMVAIGAMRAIHKSGLHIPNDISVIGLNNIEVAEYVRPALTTINVPKEDIGRFAVKLLVDRINGGHEVDALLKLPFSLIDRESCGVCTEQNNGIYGP